MYAYDIDYLDDAMCHIGEMLDYVVYDLHYKLNDFWKMFTSSKVCKWFSMGSPKYNAGMSGVELAWEVIYEMTGQRINVKPSRCVDCSKEYWAGWILAFYQHRKNISFSRLSELGLSATDVVDMYILHEADLEKFADEADLIIEKHLENQENRLRRIRRYAELTQKELSEQSGVSLRMVQLYEQGQNDLAKAQVGVVMSLAQALHCEIGDIL